MKEFRNPVFDAGILSIILFIAGIFILNTSEHYGYIVLFSGTGLGIIFSLITIVEVALSKLLKGQKKILWLMIVFLVPVLGSFMYYIFSGSNEKRRIE
ncbi:MAG: PLDc N-terminal domain-containing protein [Ginsengibacter sp.]